MHGCTCMHCASVARNRTCGDACVAGCIDESLETFIERHFLHSMLPLFAEESIATLATLKKLPLHYWKNFCESSTLLDIWKDIHSEVRRLKGLGCMHAACLHHGSIVC